MLENLLEEVKQLLLEMGSLFFIVLIYLLSGEITSYGVLSSVIIAITLLAIIVIFHSLKSQKSDSTQKIFADLVFVSLVICILSSFMFFVIGLSISYGLVGIISWIIMVTIVFIGVYTKETPKNKIFENSLRKRVNMFASGVN